MRTALCGIAPAARNHLCVCLSHRRRPVRSGVPDPLLTEFLEANDAACPVCGYGLRGLRTDLCPECGVPIRLGVHTPDTRLASWITAVVTLSMTTGFFTVMLLLVLIGSLFNTWGGGPPWSQFWPIVVGSPLGLASVATLVASRRRFRKAPAATRWAINGIGNGVMVGLLGYWLYVIF